MLREFAKQILPRRWHKPANNLRALISYWLVRAFAWSEFTASLYYLLVSREFRREHLAVLQGRRRYSESRRAGAGSLYLLRRNIHRLEKGLIMRPRRPVFATEYIAETVDHYCRVARVADNASTELQWAGDVLWEYFLVSAESPILESSRRRFLHAYDGQTSRPIVPRPRGPYLQPPIRFDDFLSLTVRRRSVRWFAPQTVPRALIDQAVLAAAMSPSACNRQPYRFIVFDEPMDAARIGALAAGTAGFASGFQCLAVLVGSLNAYLEERDRHLIYIDTSLAAMGFMLALETLGLSSCPINWPDVAVREHAMAEALQLPDEERVIMLIAIGYADPEGGVPASAKRDIEAVRSYYRASEASLRPESDVRSDSSEC